LEYKIAVKCIYLVYSCVVLALTGFKTGRRIFKSVLGSGYLPSLCKVKLGEEENGIDEEVERRILLEQVVDL